MASQAETLTDDEHIHCPQCDYNLTGLEGDVCPECGRKFHREDLKCFGSNKPQPVQPWDQRTLLTLPIAFAKTCLAAWFTPGKFAENFPARYSVLSAWVFSTLCYVAAVTLHTVAAFEQGGDTGAQLLQLVAVLVVPAVACESILAVTFAVFARPPGVHHYPRPYHFYRGLTHYTGSYLILTALASTVSFVLLFAVLMWWWIGLGSAVRQRSRPTQDRLVAILCIPFVGLGSYVIALLLACVVSAIAGELGFKPIIRM